MKLLTKPSSVTEKKRQLSLPHSLKDDYDSSSPFNMFDGVYSVLLAV